MAKKKQPERSDKRADDTRKGTKVPVTRHKDSTVVRRRMVDGKQPTGRKPDTTSVSAVPRPAPKPADAVTDVLKTVEAEVAAALVVEPSVESEGTPAQAAALVEAVPEPEAVPETAAPEPPDETPAVTQRDELASQPDHDAAVDAVLDELLGKKRTKRSSKTDKKSAKAEPVAETAPDADKPEPVPKPDTAAAQASVPETHVKTEYKTEETTKPHKKHLYKKDASAKPAVMPVPEVADDDVEVEDAPATSDGKATPAATAEAVVDAKAAPTQIDADDASESAPSEPDEAATAAPAPDHQPAAAPAAPAPKLAPPTDPAEKSARRRKVLVGLLSLLLVCAMGFGVYIVWLNHQSPIIESVQVAEELNEDTTVRMTVQVSTPHFMRTELWCALSKTDTPPAANAQVWAPVVNGSCSFDVESGAHYVFAMDSRGNISSPDNETVEINETVSISIDKDKLYLPLEGVDRLAADLFIIGDVADTVSWSSKNTAVATVDATGLVRAVAEGETEITATSADGKTAVASVMVTDLFKTENIDTYSKPMLNRNPYSDEEAHLLDDILLTKVAQAGYGTRAGTVAAARFLALEFEYRVPYFFENGRLNPHNGRPTCDGEGRFYHQGLFLCECKFEDLDPIRYGPATWGQLLLNFETKYAFVGGQRYPNGLDCSGFVCWTLINGGTDVGDMGAGDEYGDNDLCDLADKLWLTNEVLKSDKIQVGDLIASDGHMAIIIGLTEDRIYIAESLFTSVRVTNFPRNMSVVYSSLYDYVIPMGEIYEGEGNLTQYWEIEGAEQDEDAAA